MTRPSWGRARYPRLDRSGARERAGRDHVANVVEPDDVEQLGLGNRVGSSHITNADVEQLRGSEGDRNIVVAPEADAGTALRLEPTGGVCKARRPIAVEQSEEHVLGAGAHHGAAAEVGGSGEGAYHGDLADGADGNRVDDRLVVAGEGATPEVLAIRVERQDEGAAVAGSSVDRAAAEIHAASEAPAHEHVAVFIDSDGAGDVRFEAAEALAPEHLAFGVELGHEGVVHSSAGEGPEPSSKAFSNVPTRRALPLASTVRGASVLGPAPPRRRE